VEELDEVLNKVANEINEVNAVCCDAPAIGENITRLQVIL
jgi:hypothetical protein